MEERFSMMYSNNYNMQDAGDPEGSGQPRSRKLAADKFCGWYADRAREKVKTLIPKDVLGYAFRTWRDKGECVGLVVFPNGDQQMVDTGPEFSLREWKEVVGKEEFLRTGVAVKWQVPEEVFVSGEQSNNK